MISRVQHPQPPSSAPALRLVQVGAALRCAAVAGGEVCVTLRSRGSECRLPTGCTCTILHAAQAMHGLVNVLRVAPLLYQENFLRCPDGGIPLCATPLSQFTDQVHRQTFSGCRQPGEDLLMPLT